MGYDNFRDEVRRLAHVESLTPDTDISKFDSMAKTEVCILAEEHLKIELPYAQVHEACKLGKYTNLQDVLAENGYGP